MTSCCFTSKRARATTWLAGWLRTRRDSLRVRLFGNRTLMAERMRDANVNRWVDAGVRNLRYAVRILWRSPGFTAAVVLSMALGIGANTAVFSLLNAVVLKTLPVKNPQELVILEAHVNGPGGERTALDWHGDFRNFQVNARPSTRAVRDVRNIGDHDARRPG
jgi:hypothetical protein